MINKHKKYLFLKASILVLILFFILFSIDKSYSAKRPKVINKNNSNKIVDDDHPPSSGPINGKNAKSFDPSLPKP